MTTSEKISSIRETINGGYRKPEAEKQESYVTNLECTPSAQEYLLRRGISLDTAKHFGLGYDYERKAISIPVYKNGELINIRYRSVDPDAKVRYTQERGCEVWVFNEKGISDGVSKGGVLITEGEFDCMTAWQAGFKNVISPSSGKDSYGPWIELLDSIARVYIAYDNDKPGKKAALDFANRIGIDKCMEVLYPEGIKDANDFFATHTADEFRAILKAATPYYRNTYKGVGDIIEALRGEKKEYLELDFMPYVKFENDWVAVLSGDSNAGKTSWSLNLADEMVSKDMPVLVLPYERGINYVGQRYLQIRYNKRIEDFPILSNSEWDKLRDDAVQLPLYFAVPIEQEFEDTVRRAKRLFNVRAVVIDHLDYFIKGDNEVSKQKDFMMRIKTLAQELNVIFFVVHHINKPKTGLKTKPRKEDLKGAAAIYQIAEVVAMLYRREPGTIDVIIDKNKGEEGTRTYIVDMTTGRFEKGVYNVPTVSESDDW